MKTLDSTLELALLGLVQQKPMSGYDLRKVFEMTAMGGFSDSPGAIYPALGRLEKRELVCGTVQESSSLRKRRVFKITAAGLAAFKAWLKMPVTRDDVVRRVGDLMLRFAFMEPVLGTERSVIFLREYGEEVAGYIRDLQAYLALHSGKMPQSARLALECGIQEYETRVRWAKSSLALYERGKRNKI